jgi:hypothetical protein
VEQACTIPARQRIRIRPCIGMNVSGCTCGGNLLQHLLCRLNRGGQLVCLPVLRRGLRSFLTNALMVRTLEVTQQGAL